MDRDLSMAILIKKMIGMGMYITIDNRLRITWVVGMLIPLTPKKISPSSKFVIIAHDIKVVIHVILHLVKQVFLVQVAAMLLKVSVISLLVLHALIIQLFSLHIPKMAYFGDIFLANQIMRKPAS